MKTINVKLCDITNNINDIFDTNAIITDSTIKYVDNNKTKVLLNYIDNILIRENSDNFKTTSIDSKIIDNTIKNYKVSIIFFKLSLYPLFSDFSITSL